MAARGELAAAMQQALLDDVDAKVAEKVEELWQKGKQMLSQVQQKHQERNDKLNDEVSRCLERQRTLEAENEQLKEVLADMTARISLLGAAFSRAGPGCVATPVGGSAANSTASASPPPPRGGSDPLEVFTPVRGGTTASEAVAPLPEVPAFPFPSQPTPTTSATASPGMAAPLRLSEALGTRSPERFSEHQQTPTLLSLATSLPQGPSMEAYAASAPMVFSFTLRKADETDLGLNVSHREQEQVLCVEGVRAEGAVDAWNRQCLGGAFPEKAVLPGDMIISVNNVAYDPDRMLEECKERQLLRLTIARGGLPVSEAAPQVSAAGASPTPATSLRAEASEFVPQAAAAAQAATAPAEADTTPAGGGPAPAA